MLNSHEQRKFKTGKAVDQLSQHSFGFHLPINIYKKYQRYQLPAEYLPASLHEKTPDIMEKPKTPLASKTPNNPTKEFWHLHGIQDVFLDFASFPQLPPNLLLCMCYKARHL
jgi:hypothetical protein